MQTIGQLLRVLRLKEGWPLRKVAAYLDIDQAVLSKIERGQRKLNKEQVIKLAKLFKYDERQMLVTYLSDMVLHEIGDDPDAKEILKAAEQIIACKTFVKPDRISIINNIVEILQQFSKVSKAWVYGSFARQDDGPESDIDIAVKTDEGFSYFDLAEIQHRLQEEIKRKIDIGFIDSFRPHIYKNVSKDLRLFYERP